MEATEVTTATHMAVATTTARDPLMLSPPCSLEPAVLCPPPLLSSTTPQSSLPWPTMVFPSWLLLSLLLRRPWLPSNQVISCQVCCRCSRRGQPTPSLLLLITASLTGVDFVLFLCLVPAIRALLLFY